MGDGDTFLISKLIEETYSDSGNTEKPSAVTDLQKYFDKRRNQVDYISITGYLEQNHLSHQALCYKKNSKCYRLSFKQSVIDCFELN